MASKFVISCLNCKSEEIHISNVDGWIMIECLECGALEDNGSQFY